MEKHLKNNFDMLNLLIDELNSQKNEDNLNLYKTKIIKYLNEIQKLTDDINNGNQEIINLANIQKDIIDIININNNLDSLKKLVEENKNNINKINEIIEQNIKINNQNEINENKDNTQKNNKHKNVEEKKKEYLMILIIK